MDRKIIILCTLVLIIWCIGFVYFISLIPKHNVPQKISTDAIIVLTGGKNRIGSGIKLLEKNPSKKLFITGVDIKVKGIQIMASLSQEVQDKIEFEQTATTTLENAIETRKWTNKNEIKSITLVTANYHMPRVQLLFKRMLHNVKIEVHPVFSPNFEVGKWWKSFSSTKLLIKEYSKYLIVLYHDITA